MIPKDFVHIQCPRIICKIVNHERTSVSSFLRYNLYFMVKYPLPPYPNPNILKL